MAGERLPKVRPLAGLNRAQPEVKIAGIVPIGPDGAVRVTVEAAAAKFDSVDDPAVRNATRLLLSVEGYSVTAVSSIAEAQQTVSESQKLDLLITDYHLREGETGLAVIAAMRQALGPELKALLITGDTSSVVRKISQDANLRIISKPVNADEMLGLLETLLSS